MGGAWDCARHILVSHGKEMGYINGAKHKEIIVKQKLFIFMANKILITLVKTPEIQETPSP